MSAKPFDKLRAPFSSPLFLARHERAPKGRVEWTRMQCIRTLSEIPLELHVFTETPFLYQEISEQAKKLKRLGMSYCQIGRALGIDDKTVKKAVLFAEAKEFLSLD